jgi:hypothetical protein
VLQREVVQLAQRGVVLLEHGRQLRGAHPPPKVVRLAAAQCSATRRVALAVLFACERNGAGDRLQRVSHGPTDGARGSARGVGGAHRGRTTRFRSTQRTP